MTTLTFAEPEIPIELREQLERIEAIKRDALALVDGLTDDQLNWRPDATRWSIAQCLSHILLSGGPYLARLDALLEDARQRERAGLPAFRQGFVSRWFIRSMEPPPRFKAKTFRTMEPGATFRRDDLIGEFIAFHDDLGARVRAMRGVDPDRARMNSPFFRPLRFTLGQAVALLVTHARRHLWQARQVRQHPSFPG
jgi:hypothetical protein